MKNGKNKPSGKDSRRLVDLIYLDEKKLISDLEDDYQARIDNWTDWMNRKLDSVVSQGVYIEEQNEYFVINNLLRNFLAKRLEWIQKAELEDTLRHKYLQALPPFNQEGSIKTFLLHFFQLKDSSDQQDLVFNQLDKSEREIRILWDIYKITKTMETMEVIRASTAATDPFPTIFDRLYIVDLLNTLSNALILLVRICVKKEHEHEILYDFPLHCFETENILYRKERNSFLIKDSVLERLDYRNFIFHIYFRTSLKTSYKGEEVSFSYNYLDYEIVRQEFLIHWLFSRLNNNPKKKQILDRYVIDGKTFSEIIAASPGTELMILKQLPKLDFEQLITDVNESLEGESQLPFDLMSETIGGFSKKLFLFKAAKKIAQKSVQAIKKLLIKQKESENNSAPESTETVQKTQKPKYIIELLDKSEIDFPFFCTVNSEFSRKQVIIRSRMEPAEFLSFSEQVKGLINSTDEDFLIKRRTPRHEWVVPYMVKDTSDGRTIDHLLILGVEAKNQHMSMGYGSGLKEEFDLFPYFIYGSKQKQKEMGSPEETRTIRNEKFHIYFHANPNATQQALKLFEAIIGQSQAT